MLAGTLATSLVMVFMLSDVYVALAVGQFPARALNRAECDKHIKPG